MNQKMFKVGKYCKEFNEILNLNLSEFDIYRSKGLPAHMLKSRHAKCLKYIDYIPQIISEPDYIGINPNENEAESIELIKRYHDNVLLAIKLDRSNGYFYIASMYDVSEAKIQRRLHSGRIKKINVDKKDNK